MGLSRFVIPLLVGLGSGLLSGMFGIGGGLVTTPAIKLLLGYPALVAVGTPLPVIVPSALTGAVAYARRRLSDVRSGLIVGLAGAPFSVAAAKLADVIGGPVVLALTGILIVYVAFKMVLSPRTAQLSAEELPARRDPAGLVVLGVAAGLYSGLLGLGGGFVVVPALVRFFRFPLKRAFGTSLIAIAILAVPGSIAHWLLGHIDGCLALLLAIGVVPGAALGARVTAALAERYVRVAFSALLAGVGVLLLLDALGVP